MTDEESMALCAVRYTIGRMSYIVGDGYRWARKYGQASAQVRRVLIRDLEEAVARCDDDRRDGQPHIYWLGFESDENGWREVLRDLKALEAPHDPR